MNINLKSNQMLKDKIDKKKKSQKRFSQKKKKLEDGFKKKII
jgi:hypothetical protein